MTLSFLPVPVPVLVVLQKEASLAAGEEEGEPLGEPRGLERGEARGEARGEGRGAGTSLAAEAAARAGPGEPEAEAAGMDEVPPGERELAVLPPLPMTATACCCRCCCWEKAGSLSKARGGTKGPFTRWLWPWL